MYATNKFTLKYGEDQDLVDKGDNEETMQLSPSDQYIA